MRISKSSAWPGVLDLMQVKKATKAALLAVTDPETPVGPVVAGLALAAGELPGEDERLPVAAAVQALTSRLARPIDANGLNVAK